LFRRCWKYFSGKDGSAPLEKLARMPVAVLSSLIKRRLLHHLSNKFVYCLCHLCLLEITTAPLIQQSPTVTLTYPTPTEPKTYPTLTGPVTYPTTAPSVQTKPSKILKLTVDIIFISLTFRLDLRKPFCALCHTSLHLNAFLFLFFSSFSFCLYNAALYRIHV